MLLNSLWLFIFQANTTAGYTIATVEICGLLYTCLALMMKTTRAESLTTTEWFGMKLGFSLYAGWVTSATILNFCYMLKCFGMKEPNYDEENWAKIMLWTAFVVYNAATFAEGNPIFGSVYIWTLFAIRNNSMKEEYVLVQNQSQLIIMIHSALMGGYISYLTVKGIMK